MPPAAAIRTPTGASSSPTAARCTPTATGCSARFTTPRTPSRTPSCARGAGCRASRGEARCARGCTGSRPTRRLNAIERRPRRMLPIDHGPPADPARAARRRRSSSRPGSSPIPTCSSGSWTGAPRPRPATSAARASSWPSWRRSSTCRPTSAPRSSCARCSASRARRSPRRSRRPSPRSTAPCSGRARRSTSACPTAASRPRCARWATSACARSSSATWTRWRAATSTPWSACWPQDAVWSMPPLGAWYRGVDEIAVFLATAPLNGNWHWRHVPAQASGQAAVGSYVSDAKDGTYRAFALDVLTLRGDRIADITSFINRTTQLRDGDDFLSWPHYPADPARAARVLRGLRPARPAGLSAATRRPRRGPGRSARGTRAPSSRRPRRSSARAIVSCESPPSSWATSAIALALGQALELADEVAQVVGAHDLLVRVGAGVVQHRRVDLEVGRAHRAAQHVERAVAHDGEEPWLERHLAVVGAQGGQRADEGVLDDLLGVVVRAAEHLARVAGEPLLVARVDRVEGAVVAGAHEVDELLVGGGPVGGRVKEDRHDSRLRPDGLLLPATRGSHLAPRGGASITLGSLDSPHAVPTSGPLRHARRAARAHRGRAPRAARSSSSATATAPSACSTSPRWSA